MDRDDVRLGEQIVERQKLCKLRLPLCPARVEDAHVERPRSPRDGRADAPEADDPERGAGHLTAEKALRPRAAPSSCTDEPVALDESAPHREDEREGEIRGGRVQDSRRVRDRDPARGAGRHVDPVVADAEVRDEPERGEVVERDGLVRDDDGLDFGTGL